MQNKQMTAEELLAKMKEQTGTEPRPLTLLAKVMPDIVFEHVRSKTYLEEKTAIPGKYKLLMSLAIAAAMGSPRCTENYAKLARRTGCSDEEIVETLLVARLTKGSSVFSTSLPALESLYGEK